MVSPAPSGKRKEKEAVFGVKRVPNGVGTLSPGDHWFPTA